MSTEEAADGQHTSHDFDWTIGSKIRDGRYGPVFLGLRTDTGDLISAEELAPEGEERSTSTPESVGAILKSRLASPSQPNVISLLGYQRKEGRMFVFTEYLPGGTLRDLIRSYGAVPQALARNIVRQVALGLEQLQKQEIGPVFLDLDIVMMDNVGAVKIEAPLLGVAGLPLPPAILAPPPESLGGQHDLLKADVWLLGVMAAQLLTGDCSLAGGRSAGSVVEQIKQAQGSALELVVTKDVAGKLEKEASDLIRQCLSM